MPCSRAPIYSCAAERRTRIATRLLITGGAGFIGSHLIERLRARHEIVVLDDLSTGRRDHVPRGMAFVRADVREQDALARLMSRHRIGTVLHLAAQMNVRASIQDPRSDASVNVMGTLAALEASARAGVRRFVLASSGGAVYGEPRRLPCPESQPAAPLSPYGVAKAAGEAYARHFALARGLEVVSLRLANVYGPRQNTRGETGVAALFAERMLRGLPPVFFGDGRQTRDYVYVEDVARAFDAALRCRPGTYNIGTGVETPLHELVRTLRSLTGFRDRPIRKAGIPGEVRRIALDPRRARRVLRWTARVPLQEGLARTVQALAGGT